MSNKLNKTVRNIMETQSNAELRRIMRSIDVPRSYKCLAYDILLKRRQS